MHALIGPSTTLEIHCPFRTPDDCQTTGAGTRCAGAISIASLHCVATFDVVAAYHEGNSLVSAGTIVDAASQT